MENGTRRAKVIRSSEGNQNSGSLQKVGRVCAPSHTSCDPTVSRDFHVSPSQLRNPRHLGYKDLNQHQQLACEPLRSENRSQPACHPADRSRPVQIAAITAAATMTAAAEFPHRGIHGDDRRPRLRTLPEMASACERLQPCAGAYAQQKTRLEYRSPWLLTGSECKIAQGTGAEGQALRDRAPRRELSGLSSPHNHNG